MQLVGPGAPGTVRDKLGMGFMLDQSLFGHSLNL